MKNDYIVVIGLLILQSIIVGSLGHPVKYWIILISVVMGVYMLLRFRKVEEQGRRHVINLSKSLEDILNNRDFDFRDLSKDELLSKVKHQLIRILDLLDYHHEKEKSERTRLEGLIGDISHQLKTPLANLKMYQDLLRTCPDEDRERFHQSLEKQVEKLEWLIESLLKLSKVESGCIQVQSNEQDLDKTIIEAIGMIHLKANKKRIFVDYKPSKYQINHDKKWTCEAIYNVLDNAVKYSPEDSLICIQVMDSDLFTDIQVIDQGPGILVEDLNRIFKRFHRGQGSENYEGVGIGLYLSQEIMKRQGGYIYAKNKIIGSQFNIKLRKTS